MHRWTALVGSLMLVLMLWTGGLARAAETAACIPATTESAGHYEGDGDQRPSDRDQGAAHHHASCSGHQVAAPAEAVTPGPASPQKTLPDGREAFGLAGRVPDHQLRPPIA